MNPMARSILWSGLFLFHAFSGLFEAGPAAPGIAAAEQTLSFPMKRRPLEGRLAGMALLEGSVKFEKSLDGGMSGIPAGLTDVEFARIPLSPGTVIAGIRGRNESGRPVVVFDRDADGHLANEPPVEFADEAEGRTASIPVSVRETREGRPFTIGTTLILHERKAGKWEYHFDEAWETKLEFGGETLSVACQRWPILFLDAAFSGLYEKIFFPDREVLGLGGRFFRLAIDFSGEKLILTETGAKPIDAGYEAPDFEASLRGSDRMFKLSENKGKAVVLTFWSPLCSGSKAEAASYDRLAQAFAGDERVCFIASVTDAPPLEAYLKEHRHAYPHVVGPQLWEKYGVTAPFVTFLIDQSGRIVKRMFRFDPGLEGKVRALIEKSPVKPGKGKSSPSDGISGSSDRLL